MTVNTVSVIICTYNRSGLLADTLRSLTRSLSTFRKPVEVLVVNNASTDDTDEVVASLIKETPSLSIRLLHENRNGVSFARNTGMEQAQGDIFCFLDDDVIVPDGWLDGLLSAFERSDAAGAVAGRIELHFPDVSLPAWLDSRYNRLFGHFQLTCEDRSPFIRKRGEDFFGGNVALTRKAASVVGLFNTALGRKQYNLLGGEDTEYAERLWKKGFVIVYSFQGYIYHRVHPERMTYRWIARNYFWAGVTNSLRRQWYYPLSVLPRSLMSSWSVLFNLLIFNKKRYVLSSFRIVNACGALYGLLLNLTSSTLSLWTRK